MRSYLTGRKWPCQTLDSILCLFVFFPSMVFYWRGIWDLFGVYIYPGDAPKCHWVTTGLGACSIVGYFTLPLLGNLLSMTQSKPVYVIVTRLYMYAFGVLNMAYWRGVWSLADFYLLQFGWKAGIIGLCVSHALLLILQGSRTTIFPPFVVTLDTRKDLLVPSTILQTQVNWNDPSSVAKYTVDSLLTQYFILTATIISWRSSLSLLDVIIFPNDWTISNAVCLAAGAGASIVLFAMETPLYRLGNRIHGRSSRWLRLVYEDVVYLAVFAAECFLWRGAWNLNVQYIITDALVGGWVNHAIGTVLLMSLQLFSYASGCGCAFDGQDATPEDAIYGTKYLRHYLQRNDKAEASGQLATTNGGNSLDCQAQSSADDKDDGICTVSHARKTTEAENFSVARILNGPRDNPMFIPEEAVTYI